MISRGAVLCIIALCVAWSYCDSVNFGKNEASSFVKFPPVMTPDSNIKNVFPRGHLKMFGCQRPPLGQVPEYFVSPTPRLLWENHAKLNRPAIIRNLLSKSPALSLWNDQYLIKEYGSQEVLVEKKFEDRKTEPKRMQIKDFLEQYDKQNWYVVSVLPNEMRKDVEVPKPLVCSSFAKNLQELNLWIGTLGTRSMLHYDADNILHCIVSGSKDWMLINPRYKFLGDMAVGHPGQGSGFSVLNVDQIDLFKSPDVADLPWEYATLNAGDCIYLPPQYLHQVRSYNRAISVTFLFFPHKNFTDDDCADVNFGEYRSLKDVYVYWGYEKGQETVDMGYKNPLQAREWFSKTCQVLNLSSMKWAEFLYVYTAFDQEYSGKEETIRKLFNDVDADRDGLVTFNELMKTDIETWKEICRNVDSPHGPTKSSAMGDPKLTNESPEFNPRANQHYVEATLCKNILFHLLAYYGDDVIPYHKFKQSVTIDPEWRIRDAFVVLDTDMDGLLSAKEFVNLPKERLKLVHSMGLELSIDQKPKIAYSIDHEDEYTHKKDVEILMTSLNKTLSNLKDSSKSGLDKDEFVAVIRDIKLKDESLKMDEDFLFKMMDRSNNGFVSVDDLAVCLRSGTKDWKDFDDFQNVESTLSEDIKEAHFGNLFAHMVDSMFVAKRLYKL